MRTLDGYLSRKAQGRLGRSALVYHEEDETYTLERAGQPALSLGYNYSLAYRALAALTNSLREDP